MRRRLARTLRLLANRVDGLPRGPREVPVRLAPSRCPSLNTESIEWQPAEGFSRAAWLHGSTVFGDRIRQQTAEVRKTGRRLAQINRQVDRLRRRTD